MEKTKACTVCKKIKSLEEFYPQGKYFSGPCKSCNTKRTAAWREKNRERHNENVRLWTIKKKYGIDPDTYRAMLKKGCEVCGGYDQLAVDHDHNCCPGKITCGLCVRGLLCKRHNWAMSNLNDSAEEARLLADYIERTRIAS
jgi:hypothetical protein